MDNPELRPPLAEVGGGDHAGQAWPTGCRGRFLAAQQRSTLPLIAHHRVVSRQVNTRMAW
jgi:hypothetical protein